MYLLRTIICLACLLVCGSCSQVETNPISSKPETNGALSKSPLPSSASPIKNGDYSARGKITKINTELKSVELDHEDIPGVMPKMIMEFYVVEPAKIDALKVG
ncbi:MAG: copper-binding protein, partial [Blastocatellia bacterium]|nr:copper-binding protein [Blastocatellia bacterium]